VRVNDFSPPSAGKVVAIYAGGAGGSTSGPGGWGAVLTYGDHVREIHDRRWRTTGDRMCLLAVVRALESLKRPVPVRIWAAEASVKAGVDLLLAEGEAPRTAWKASALDEGLDLWVRLAAAVRPHEVEWTWVGEDNPEPGYERAAELARQELEAATNKVPGEAAWSSREFPSESPGTLARLAWMVATHKDRHPLAVWDHIQRTIADGAPLPEPIAELIADMGSGQGGLDGYLSIMKDPDLSRVLLPSLRRPRRPEAVTYRVRVDLRDTKPPVWRRLELASDLFLDDIHQILQVAFDWSGTHLHMFSSGFSAHSPDSEYYLCPYEVSEGKVGIPEEEVRLDEILVDTGDKMHYMYDFG
jgi:ribonuclease HI